MTSSFPGIDLQPTQARVAKQTKENRKNIEDEEERFLYIAGSLEASFLVRFFELLEKILWIRRRREGLDLSLFSGWLV